MFDPVGIERGRRRAARSTRPVDPLLTGIEIDPGDAAAEIGGNDFVTADRPQAALEDKLAESRVRQESGAGDTDGSRK